MNSVRTSVQVNLATPVWLEPRLGAPWLRVVDVRTDPFEPGSGTRLRGDDPPRFVEIAPGAGWMRAGRHIMRRSKPPRCYLAGHVPGAANLDVAGRLFDEGGTLACAPELAMTMSELGVGDEHTVVLVDDAPMRASMVAAWALTHYGHADVLVLAGGFPRWVAERRPVSRDAVRHVCASFTARVSR
jgi:thiosulfate/3-mercaptopyruvate sulfurtransferase